MTLSKSVPNLLDQDGFRAARRAKPVFDWSLRLLAHSHYRPGAVRRRVGSEFLLVPRKVGGTGRVSPEIAGANAP